MTEIMKIDNRASWDKKKILLGFYCTKKYSTIPLSSLEIKKQKLYKNLKFILIN